MARCVGGRGARMAWTVEERGHGVALWMVAARMAECRRGEDGGICWGGNPWNHALPSMECGEGENGRAAAEASLNCVLPSIESDGGRQRAATCESGLLRLGEDRGINGARARGCRRQNHGARVVKSTLHSYRVVEILASSTIQRACHYRQQIPLLKSQQS